MKLVADPDAKALIFDLDGTLANTMPLHLKAWKNICIKYGFEYPDELFYQLAGLSSEKIAMILVERFHLIALVNPKDFAIRKENAFHEMHDQIEPIVPVVNLVYQHFKKIPLAIGSGGNGTAVNDTLDKLNLRTYFDVIVTAEDVENHKPAPDTFLKCAELLQIDPSKCQVFEDGERGIEAARRAGMMVTDITPWHPKHTF